MKTTNSLSYSNLKTRNEQAYNCKTGKPCIAAQCAATYSLMQNPCNTDTSPPSFLVMPAPLPLSCPACTSAMLFGSDIQKQVFAYRSPHSHLTGHLLSLPSPSPFVILAHSALLASALLSTSRGRLRQGSVYILPAGILASAFLQPLKIAAPEICERVLPRNPAPVYPQCLFDNPVGVFF